MLAETCASCDCSARKRRQCSERYVRRPRTVEQDAPLCSAAFPRQIAEEEASIVRAAISTTCEHRNKSSVRLAVRTHGGDEAGFGFLTTKGGLQEWKVPALA